MRKCAPEGSECVLTFKPVTLIDASGLDEAQVTHSGTFVPRCLSSGGRNARLFVGAVSCFGSVFVGSSFSLLLCFLCVSFA